MAEERKSRVDARDLLGLAGVVLLGYGCWLVYQPAAFMVTGVIFIAAAALAARR